MQVAAKFAQHILEDAFLVLHGIILVISLGRIAASILQVGNLSHALDTDKLLSVFVDSPDCCLQRIFLRKTKFAVSALYV